MEVKVAPTTTKMRWYSFSDEMEGCSVCSTVRHSDAGFLNAEAIFPSNENYYREKSVVSVPTARGEDKYTHPPCCYDYLISTGLPPQYLACCVTVHSSRVEFTRIKNLL